MSSKLQHLTKLSDINKETVKNLVELACKVKKNPENYSKALEQKTLLMIFEKPSLRTRISFEVGMTQLGGHAIFYDLSNSVMGSKESISDSAKVMSRYVDVIMARLFKREHIRELAKYATVPLINALDDFGHPCQILCDILTIYEKKGTLTDFKMSYFGDCRNNVTYDLMRLAAILGFELNVSGPSDKEHEIEKEVWDEVKSLEFGKKVKYFEDPHEAIKGSDVVYTDTWMSYGINEKLKQQRIKVFKKYQVNEKLLKGAKKDFIFMNCLPAMREMEQTTDVIDGENSVVFDQAENRLHMQKAIILHLLNTKS